MACSDCGLLDECRKVIGVTEYDKPPCGVVAENSTSDNKQSEKLPAEIIEQFNKAYPKIVQGLWSDQVHVVDVVSAFINR